MSYKRILPGLFIITIITCLFGFVRIADDPISKIAAQLDKWFKGNPQEKVYLQLDKPYYAIGDDIWFKAYAVTGSTHELSSVSSILNVELIDDRDSVKQSIKLPMRNGITWGDFALIDSLKEGNYRIRAYTNWMRNAGEEYFFNKTITIVNAVGNNVNAKADFSYSSQNGQQKVSAVINYADLDGTPYPSAQVTYEIKLGSKTVSRGRGQTDSKGNLTVNFNNNASDLKSGLIISNIKLSDKKVVTKSILIKATSDKVDMQFFPEGGSMVAGNETKVAFKAVSATGLGADVKGVITDDQNTTVATFASEHLGMGTFNLKPESGKQYKARVTFADGSERTIDLPAAASSGYSLSVSNEGADKIRVQIIGGPAVTTGSEVVSLIAQSGGVIYYAGKSKPGSKFFSTTILKSKFPTGIVQFTLFSSTAEPLNERLVFIQNNDEEKLDITSAKASYAPREKVKLDINARNEDEKPMVGIFSLAVTDETTVPVDEANESTIMSNLLLTSDLKGYIEKPNYYFTNTNAKTASDLDGLMLTQGYHRFEWKQVINDAFPPIVYEPEKTLSITGHIKTLGGKPIPNGKVTLFTNTGGVFMLDTVSDINGKFVFRNLFFRDSVNFIIQGRTAKDRKYVQIDIDNVDRQKVGRYKNFPDFEVNVSSSLSPFLHNSKRWYSEQLKYGINNNFIQLKEVVIKDKKEPVAKDSQNLNGPGNADQVLTGEALQTSGCAFIADCLQGRLTGVIFRNGVPYSTRSPNRAMEIILDGSAINDDNILNDLNPNDIESIEVLRSIGYTAIYGGRANGGVLIITTKRGGGDYNVKRYAPGILNYSPKGYHKVREFYSPQYDNPKTNTQVADLRSTIYWNPNIITNKEGKGSVEFFNADSKGTYRVVVEGVDLDGNLARKVYRYKVE